MQVHLSDRPSTEEASRKGVRLSTNQCNGALETCRTELERRATPCLARANDDNIGHETSPVYVALSTQNLAKSGLYCHNDIINKRNISKY